MSTEFKVEVVPIKEIKKHPDSERLGIVEVYGFPVVIRVEDFQGVDRAAYIPVDGWDPNDQPRFAFLQGKKVRAKKLRGIFSMGVLIPPTPDERWEIGQDVSKELGIIKYEIPPGATMGGDNDSTPGWFHDYTKLAHLRRYPNLLVEGEDVVISEKVHGFNLRVAVCEGTVVVGSHHNTKRRDPNSCFWQAALKISEDVWKKLEGLVLVGEGYGNVKNYWYGPQKRIDSVFYDAYRISDGKYLNYAEFVELAKTHNLPTSPILYHGPWLGLQAHEELAEGPSKMPEAKNIREGFVVRPTTERWDREVGRCIFKLKGKGFLLGGGDDGVEGMET